MTVPKHESNNPNLSRILLNDLNSRDAAEQCRDQEAKATANASIREAAAKQAETDRVAKEAAMVKALKDAREENEVLRAKTSELEKTMEQNTKLAKAQLEREERTKLDPVNDLPLEWHGKNVYMVCLGSTTAVDMGGESFSTTLGWNHEWDNATQRLFLEKVDMHNPKSAWTIANTYSDVKRFIEYENGSMRSNTRKTGAGEKQQQEWYIGSDGLGAWVMNNAKMGLRLEMGQQFNAQNGYTISLSQSVNPEYQRFVLFRCW